MALEIELCIFEPILPVNVLAILRRIEEILRANETNSTLGLNGEALVRVQACLLILWELAKFESYDVAKEWLRVSELLKPAYIAYQLKQ